MTATISGICWDAIPWIDALVRKALCRDSHGRANGPLGAALDIIARDNQYR